MRDFLKFLLFITALALLTIWFGKGFQEGEKPIEPQSSPLQNTLDAAHKAASQLSR